MAEPELHAFRPVTLDFLAEAPLRFRVDGFVALPRDKVWAAFSDPTGWPHWFPFTDRAHYEGPPPYGVGTVRQSWVSGDRYEETMLIWEEPHRWGYRIDRASTAIASAQIEVTEFEEVPGGTRVIWTLATDPLPSFHYLAGERDFIAFLREILGRALRALETHLTKS